MRAAQQWIASPASDQSRLNGVNQLIVNALTAASASDVTIACGDRASLAGWLQESSVWDLVLLQHGHPVLAVTYTSITRHPEQFSFDDQVNRALGLAKDTQLAQAHGILPASLRRAHVHLQELSPRNIDQLRQAGTTCERMRDSGLHDLAWAVGVTRDPIGFTEPAPAVGWDRFVSDLRSGHRN